MAGRRPVVPPRDAAASAHELAAIASAPSVEEALRRAAGFLGALGDAPLSAVFHVRDGEIVREAWRSGAASRTVETAVRVKRAALAEADGGDASAGCRVTRATVASAGSASADTRPDGATQATAESVVWARDGGSEPSDVEPLAGGVLALLAARLAMAAAESSQRVRQDRYERWFQTLDAQLRVLDRERQKFAAVANQPDSYAFVTDASRTVRWLNKAMGAVLAERGVHGEWVGRACLDVCGALGLTRVEDGCDGCHVRRAFVHNEPTHREVRTQGPGAGRDLYLTALPIKGPDGRPLEVLGQIQDVTNLEVVRRAKERLETVVSGAPIVLYAIDREGRFTLSVGKGLETLGLAPGEVVGRSAFDMYRGVPDIVDSLHRALAGETHTRMVQVGDLAFDAFYAPLRDPDGTIAGMVGVATDVTERRRAEEALRRSEEQLRHAQRIEAVGSLAGGVAHDFNNLLTALFGHLNFLRRRIPPETDIAREVEAIGRAAERAASLTRQLLAFSRKQVLQLRAVDANEVLLGMEPMLRRLIREDVDLRIHPDATDPWITADPGQVEQVVMNLAVNARDAMPGGGRLTIRSANVTVGAAGRDDPAGSEPAGAIEARDPIPPGRYVSLTVRDSGTGMDAATQERAFEPFFTTKPVGQGTGLGLSTVYGIVKQSGGEIFLTSAPGSGATFTVYFPLTEPAERSAASPGDAAAAGPPAEPAGDGDPARRAEPALAAPRGGETILLVEDEGMVRDLFRDVLTQAGYVVREAAGGGEALEIAARRDVAIHLMVTDVVMPGMSGGELVERMAALRPEVRVIYVSGYTDDVLVRRGVLDSGVPFLQKPCMPDQLTRAVRAALDAPGVRPAAKR